MPAEATGLGLDPDGPARKRAVEANVPVVVRAPAGSGKTELLIQRFLRLLGEVDTPEAVMALTFTRKAAGEMRERLFEALAAAEGPAPAAPHRRRTWELARRARQRDADLGWELSRSPAQLRLQTLDGLARELVGRMPWLTRLGPTPQPTEAAGKLYRAATRATLRQGLEGTDPRLGNAARLLLQRLNGDVDKAEQLLATLLTKRDQWLPWLGEGTQGVEDDLAAVLTAEAAALRPQLEQAGVSGVPTDADPAAWRALAGSVLTTTGEARKRKPNPDLAPKLCARLHRTRAWPSPSLAAEERSLTSALLVLLPRALAEMQVSFQERGECDFTEITLAAVRALGAPEAPSALAFAFDARLQHLLVDEYQDTSRAQHQLLLALIGDWSDGDGRTLFLVGDPMQSIYRFRNAKVDLFLRAEREGRFGQLALERIALSRNYRSGTALVEWCNRQFEPHAGMFAPAQAEREGGAVEVHVVMSADPRVEALRVAELVEAELAARGDAADIAILAHARPHLTAILPALRQRGIWYQGMKLLPLRDSPVVTDLLALTRAIHDPADRIAWLAALRAPWCGLKLADLHALCQGDRDSTVEELWAARRGRLSDDGRERAARTLAVVASATRQRGRTPARGLVEWCWRNLDGPGCWPERAHAGAAQTFWGLLDKLRTPTALPAGELEAALDGLFASADPDANTRVRVLTAHEAKGLEFDTVILPGLHKEPPPEPRGVLRWLESEDLAGQPRWLLASQPAADNKDATLYNFIGQLAQRQRNEESARLLYVAATRARHKLHLVAAAPISPRTGELSPRPHSPLAQLWPGLEAEFAAAVQRHRRLEAEAEVAAQSRRLSEQRGSGTVLRRVTAITPVTIAPPLGTTSPPQAPSFTGGWERAIGTAVHALLRRMGEADGLAWETKRLDMELRWAGVAAAAMPEARTRTRRALENIAGDADGRWILAPRPGAKCEWALAGVVEGEVVRGVVDRSFVDTDGTRWIIDYKTAARDRGQTREAFEREQTELYRGQLERYARLITTMTGTGPLRCGLYFPLHTPEAPLWLELEISR